MVPPMVPWQAWPPKLVQPWSIGMHSASAPSPAACARLLRVRSASRLKRVRPSFSQAPLSKQSLHQPPMLPRRKAHDPYLSGTGGWRCPSRAVRHLRACGSCDRSDHPTGPALRQVCEHVQPRIDRRTERLRDDPRTTDPMHLIMETTMETLTKHEFNL